MYGLLIGLVIVVSILLILVVLIQKPKGGGLAAQFSSTNLAFGVKRTSDFIEKATWGLAIAIIVISLSTNFVAPTATAGTSDKKASNADQLQSLPSTPMNQPQQAPPAEGTQPQQNGNGG